VVHRSDGSGTTYIFTDYLSNVSSDWKTNVGTSKSVQWPTGVGGKGNAGVAAQVRNTPGAIGYVELAYVLQNNMQQAYVKNKAGKYLQASVAGATAAAAQASNIDAANFSITDEPGDSSYPITTFSWVVLHKKATDDNKGKEITHLFKWLVTDGQTYGKDLQYAPLPTAVQNLALTNLKTITDSTGKAYLS